VQPACWRTQAEKLAPFLMEIDRDRAAAGIGAGAVAALRGVGIGTVAASRGGAGQESAPSGARGRGRC
jgi:hypothetical protein